MQVYDEVHDYSSLYKTLMEALAEYNETNATMDLVLFEDAMKHVCRIARIISNPSGHALLVGARLIIVHLLRCIVQVKLVMCAHASDGACKS